LTAGTRKLKVPGHQGTILAEKRKAGLWFSIPGARLFPARNGANYFSFAKNAGETVLIILEKVAKKDYNDYIHILSAALRPAGLTTGGIHNAHSP